MTELAKRRRALLAAQGEAIIINGSELTWTQGLTNLYYGTLQTNDYYISSDFIDIADKQCAYIGSLTGSNNINYRCYILQYDANGKFISYLSVCENGVVHTVNLSAFCVRIKFTFGYPSDSGVTITPTEGSAVKIKAITISKPEVTWLYNNGTVSELLGSFITGIGFGYNTTYNTIKIEANAITYSNTSTSTASTIKGGNSVSSQNTLPSAVIGKRIYFRGTHKNTSSSQADRAYLIISDSVTKGTDLATAFGSDYKSRSIICMTNAAATLFGSQLSLSKVGYLSLIGRKTAAGASTIVFKEVWIE